MHPRQPVAHQLFGVAARCPEERGVALQLRQLQAFAGVDVILVHRMLKNQVPVLEYVLMTEPVAQCLDESVRQLCKPLTHDFEGIGQTSTHYIDLATSEVVPTVPERRSSGRLGAKLKLELSTLPFVLGVKKACVGFRHLGRGANEVPQT